MEDLDYLKSAVNQISSYYLNLQIKNDENGDFKQYISEDTDDADKFEFFNLNENKIDEFITDFLESPLTVYSTPHYIDGSSLKLIRNQF